MLSFSSIAIAQENVTLFGVDYSSVNVIGADEPDEGFIKDFKYINDVMADHTKYYKIDKYLKLNVVSIDVSTAKERVDVLKNRKFRNLAQNTINLEEIIAPYPKVSGEVLLFVCKELNKDAAIGIHEVVVFDGETKKIIKSKEIKCNPYGFGMATYWNYTIMVGLKKAAKQSFRVY